MLWPGSTFNVHSCANQTTSTITPAGSESVTVYTATNTPAANGSRSWNCPPFASEAYEQSADPAAASRTKWGIPTSGKRGVMLLLLFNAPAAGVEEHISTSGRTASQSPEYRCHVRLPPTGPRHSVRRKTRLSGAGTPD